MYREFGKLWPMPVKLFILGLPGSGKSAIARYDSIYARDRQLLSTTHVNDFAILYEMFQADTKGQFKPTDFGGFDVLDFTVLDIALKKLEQIVNHYFSAKSDEIILIEFSRNDYHKAFHQFSQEFLRGAYFLYLAVDIETCKRRIRERIANPSSEDDFYVSEYIFTTYYNEDNGRSLPQILKRDYGIDKQRVKIIENNGSLQDIVAQINGFVDIICGLEIMPES
jgi:adenylate kinase family enzyme